MVQKSKFSKKSQTIPKLDSTSREQCLAISKQFYCSPNFSTRSDRWLFLTLIDGDHGDFENSQNFFESLNNSAKIFVKHCDVWETFGQTPKIQSLLLSIFSSFFPKSLNGANSIQGCQGMRGDHFRRKESGLNIHATPDLIPPGSNFRLRVPSRKSQIAIHTYKQ